MAPQELNFASELFASEGSYGGWASASISADCLTFMIHVPIEYGKQVKPGEVPGVLEMNLMTRSDRAKIPASLFKRGDKAHMRKKIRKTCDDGAETLVQTELEESFSMANNRSFRMQENARLSFKIR